jgi:hypothetical protein
VTEEKRREEVGIQLITRIQLISAEGRHVNVRKVLNKKLRQRHKTRELLYISS